MSLHGSLLNQMQEALSKSKLWRKPYKEYLLCNFDWPYIIDNFKVWYIIFILQILLVQHFMIF